MSMIARGSRSAARTSRSGRVATAGQRAPVVTMLHPDWRNGWGETLAGEQLRSQIEGNPRLQRRIVAQIAAAHGAQLTEVPRLDQTTAKVAEALGVDRPGFVRLCGLAHIGRRLALATNRDDYAALARSFGKEPLAAAVRIASDLPDDAGEHGYDSDQLVPAVERMGRMILDEWLDSLPRPASERVVMMLPRERTRQESAVPTARAVSIVEGAAKAWKAPESGADAVADAGIEAPRRRSRGAKTRRRSK